MTRLLLFIAPHPFLVPNGFEYLAETAAANGAIPVYIADSSNVDLYNSCELLIDIAIHFE
jgi:hypothetical protein